MICGHCGQGVREEFRTTLLGRFVCPPRGTVFVRDEKRYEQAIGIAVMACPQCKQLIAMLGQITGPMTAENPQIGDGICVFPVVKTTRKRPSDDVPPDFVNDYWEACLVLDDSPKASAALSRRCLQNVLHNKVGIKLKNLDTEIDEWIGRGGLPTNLVESLHALRQIGNFAAHPIKIQNTGEIVDVEPGEAKWSLDTLEGVFDHCFIQPAVLQRRRDDLNAKLKAAGKPPV